MGNRARELGILALTTATAIANFVLFGLAHYRTWSDAQEYNAYAVNFLHSGIYGFDGVHFDVAREPGYPFFLALVYNIFGTENLLAVCFVQTLLLGILGYIVYRVFAESGHWKIGACAGVVVSALPSYGYYANEILTEMLFAFCLGVLFYIAVRIVRSHAETGFAWFAAFGLIAGYASLTRMQFVFFVPCMVVCFLVYVYWMQKENSGATPFYWGNVMKKTLVGVTVFLAVVGAWGFHVQKELGHFALTQGRQELVLNVRAVRSQLSYGELTQYAVEWVKRSISGGARYALLDSNEAKGITERYLAIATTSEMVAQIKRENIATIRAHPGQYLYGNVIEVMKMAYLEHDYTDSQSRYFRPVVYVLMYSFFLFGVWQVARNWRARQLRALTILTTLFPAYNFAILSFLDTVPRFNTPYLMFYIVIGFVGVIVMQKSAAPSENTLVHPGQ